MPLLVSLDPAETSQRQRRLRRHIFFWGRWSLVLYVEKNVCIFFVFERSIKIYETFKGSWEICRFGPFFCMWIRPRLMYQKGALVSNAKGLSEHPTHVVMIRTVHPCCGYFCPSHWIFGCFSRDGGNSNSNIFSEFSSRFFFGEIRSNFDDLRIFFKWVGSTSTTNLKSPSPVKNGSTFPEFGSFLWDILKTNPTRSSC